MKTLFNKNIGYKKIKLIKHNYAQKFFKQKKIKKLFKRTIKIVSILIILLMFLVFNNKINNHNKNNNEFLLQFEEKNNNISNYQNLSLSYITKNYRIQNVTLDELKIYLDYMDKAKKGIFLNKQNLRKSDNPKVSIIISLYNREEYINSTIRSVQNQNLSEIEIIIIDDFSLDNSVKYIKEMQKIDPRLVLLKNKKNMGTLYSKSIGVLNAKGVYILSLDSDDMLCTEDYLDSLYEEAIKGDYAFIQCEAIYLSEIQKHIIKRSPFWVVLWSKLIKSEEYRKAIYRVGKEVLSKKVVTLDDDIIAIFLFVGKKSKKSTKIGVCHFSHFGKHVYFNQFMSRESTERYCLNMINTIDSFYKMKSYSYGDHLMSYLYIGRYGPCKNYSNLTDVQKLIEIFYKNKNKTKTK